MADRVRVALVVVVVAAVLLSGCSDVEGRATMLVSDRVDPGEDALVADASCLPEDSIVLDALAAAAAGNGTHRRTVSIQDRQRALSTLRSDCRTTNVRYEGTVYGIRFNSTDR